MRLDGRRESSNVEDRRGMSGGAKAGIGGIGGIIIIALFTFLQGGNVGDVVNNVVQQTMQAPTETVGEENFTEEEQELASDCKKILASTEEVWTKVFEDNGWGEYQYPTLVLFTNQVNSACGSATAAVGPFYCSGDQKLYVDLSFFTQMKRQLGVEGNTFAYAYVIAHEIGHHIEYLTGTLGKAHQAMSQTDKVSANQISVRLELLADYYAGVWAHYEDEMNHSMEYGDLEKGLELAKAIGDDWLQKKAQGRATPESFTHGTSDQRKRWLKRGFQTGDMRTSTFSVQNYNDL
ncbi:MAG: neutral zinc metallopeptidase [Prevotella sp.]|nr:neutral zinc metallopeptidase [Prevotella sp.]MBR1557434.1 neutral zinc metallopeptidase [Prevotella sp.]